jgi:hypothetical protein
VGVLRPSGQLGDAGPAFGVHFDDGGVAPGSAQVLFMEQYKANNPWHADFFESNSVQELATDLLVRGITFGVVCGVVVGLLVRWRQRSQAA